MNLENFISCTDSCFFVKASEHFASDSVYFILISFRIFSFNCCNGFVRDSQVILFNNNIFQRSQSLNIPDSGRIQDKICKILDPKEIVGYFCPHSE